MCLGHSWHIWVGTGSNSIQPQLREKPEQAPLDLQGDTSAHVWLLGGCPGIREEAAESVHSSAGNG